MLVINPTTKAKHLNKEYKGLHQKKSKLKIDVVTQSLVSSGCLLKYLLHVYALTMCTFPYDVNENR